MRLFVGVIVIGALAALALLFVGSLGQTFAGNPFIAIGMGLAVFLAGASVLRSIARGTRVEQRTEVEDVTELDVFFVCGECGTEYRVEKLGELQVPRHCGERMLVERRPHSLPR